MAISIRKTYWFLLLWMACGVPSVGQVRLVIDSLLRTAATVSDPRARVDALNALGWEYRSFLPDSTIYYCNKAVKIAEASDYQRGRAMGLSYIGIAYSYQLENLMAMEYYEKALYVAAEIGDSIEMAYNYNNIGKIYLAQGNYPDAYTYYEMALGIFTRHENPEGMAYSYQSLSEAHRASRNIPGALAMAEAALKIRMGLPKTDSYITSLLEIAELHREAGNMQQAHQSLDKAWEMSKHLGLGLQLARTEKALAEISRDMGKFEEAYFYAKRARDKHENFDNRGDRIRIELLLADILIRRGSYSEARRQLDDVITQTQDKGLISYSVECFRLLSELFEAKKDYQKALSYHKQYLVLRDSVFNAQKVQDITDMEKRYLEENGRKQVEILEAREAQHLQEAKRERMNNIGLLLIVAFVCIILVVMQRANIRHKRLNQQLSEQSAQIARHNENMLAQNEILQNAITRLEEVNKEKDALMGVVAHDLKSPLNKIQGFVQIMKLVGGLNAEQQIYVDGIAQATEGGRRLIRDLLDVHAFEYMNTAIEWEALDIAQLLSNMIDSHRTVAEQKHIQLHFQTHEPSIMITSERSSLMRIFENLISNAVKFSPENKNVYVYIADDHRHVHITIQDEGQGFTKEDKEKAFKKFQKLSARPTGGESSTGLGLAIVKVLTEKLNGTVSLESEVGKGATFTINLPKAPNT